VENDIQPLVSPPLTTKLRRPWCGA